MRLQLTDKDAKVECFRARKWIDNRRVLRPGQLRLEGACGAGREGEVGQFGGALLFE